MLRNKLVKGVMTFALVACSTLVYGQERIIVKLKPTGVSKTATAQELNVQMARPFSVTQVKTLSEKARSNLRYSHPIAQTGAHVMLLPQGASREQMDAVIQQLKNQPDVAYVEEDKFVRVLSVPNDPSYASLWGMQPVTPTNYGADFQNAWPMSTGQGVVVAVIDSGVLPHPDIGSISPDSPTVSGNFASAGYDFISDCRVAGTCPVSQVSNITRAPVPNGFDRGTWLSAEEKLSASDIFSECEVQDSSWHGTHVAGTIAALGNNDLGVVGGAYNAKILPVRVIGKCGGGRISDIAAGMLWAAGVDKDIPNPYPAKVLNLSLGIDSFTCSFTFQSTIDAVNASGAVVVVSAGNENRSALYSEPANCRDVITVSAVDANGVRPSYSNYGFLVSIAAPGGTGDQAQAILSTHNRGKTTYDPNGFDYAFKSGTSMAAPHVSAAVALIKSVRPEANHEQIKAILEANATPLSPGACNVAASCGEGILNAKKSLEATDKASLNTSVSALHFVLPDFHNPSSLSVTLTNPAKWLPISVGTASVNQKLFSITTDTCSNQILAAGASCNINVQFTPTSSSTYLGLPKLTIPSTSQGKTVTTSIPMSVTFTQRLSPLYGVNLPISVSVGSVNDVSIGFMNSSSARVKTTAVTVSPGDIFVVSSDDCSNKTLESYATCTVKIRITPTSTGKLAGKVKLNTDGSEDTPATVEIPIEVSESTTSSIPAPTPTPTPTTSMGGGGAVGGLSLIFMLAAMLGLRRNRLTGRP